MKAEATAGAEAQTVPWWTAPGHTDMTSFMALILLFLLVFGVFHVYARFDKFAEEHNEGTPLKTTIPTLLMIAFAYEIFPPLSHFSILLPLALIVTALARDLMLWFEPRKEHILKGELESAMLDELHHEHLGSTTTQAGVCRTNLKLRRHPSPLGSGRHGRRNPSHRKRVGQSRTARLNKWPRPRREGRKRD
ncbi:hypothetical protein [Methyloceanibacter sp. wino2]|uniref:hypothetical protein n=1 Tax=Methyloceanibacter sp. wino2 TaxID=2170729 RepID=UPI000D3E1824|nr:hypothetical protein [Methyloceanibacter sp. wino2]